MIPRSLSFSSASTWRQCPARWHRRYVQKLPTKSGRAADIGTIVHGAIERFLGNDPSMRAGDGGTELMRSCAAAAWADTWERHPDREPTGQDDRRAAKNEVWGHLLRFMDWDPKPEDIAAEGLEKRVFAHIGGVPFYGVVDMIMRSEGGRRVVVDFKTGKPPSPRFAGDVKNQLHLYSEALKADSTPVDEVQVWYLKSVGTVISDKAGGVGASKAVGLHRQAWDDINNASEESTGLSGLEVYSVYQPSTGPLCGWCDWVHDCPEGMKWLKDNRRRPAI